MRPAARVAHVGPAMLTLAVAAIPTVVTLVRGDTDLAVPLLIAYLVTGAALGWATEDPAAEVLAAMPVPSSTRSLLRLTWVSSVAATGLGAVALAVAIGPGLPREEVSRLPELAAAATIAVAVGFAGTRRGDRGSGAVGVTAGVLAPVLVAAVAFRYPAWLPGFTPGSAHSRWWLMAAVGLVAAVWFGRDAGRR